MENTIAIQLGVLIFGNATFYLISHEDWNSQALAVAMGIINAILTITLICLAGYYLILPGQIVYIYTLGRKAIVLRKQRIDQQVACQT